MFSTIQRLNSVTSLATSTLLSLLLAISLISLVQKPSSIPDVNLDLKPLNVIYGKSGQVFNEKNQEFILINFDLRADLSPLFNWNTKQLFLQLTADYTTPPSTPNSIVIWDKIVTAKQSSKIRIEGGRNKYSIKERSQSFKQASNMTVRLDYNLMPYVGFLTTGEITRTTTPIKIPVPRSVTK